MVAATARAAEVPLSRIARTSSSVPTTTHPALRNRDYARRLGRHYLASNPAEADPKFLSETLFGTRLDQGANRTEPNLLGQLMLRVQEDYRLRNTDVIDGWVLSRAEARLCGLIFLTT
jgi:hypothetical protein